MTKATEIDTLNRFFVASQDGEIVFLRPLPQRLSEDHALLLAAYIVAMVADEEKWKAILAAVEST